MSDDAILITRSSMRRAERVFRAWTDPGEVAAWFGPAGRRTPRERVRIDLRVGGRFELTMVRGRRRRDDDRLRRARARRARAIVLRSDPMPAMGMPEPTFVRVELHAHGDRTRMTLATRRTLHGRAPPSGSTAAFDALDALVA